MKDKKEEGIPAAIIVPVGLGILILSIVEVSQPYMCILCVIAGILLGLLDCLIIIKTTIKDKRSLEHEKMLAREKDKIFENIASALWEQDERNSNASDNKETDGFKI